MTKWTTRDGRQIAPARMSGRHLRNALRMLHRQAKTRETMCELGLALFDGDLHDIDVIQEDMRVQHIPRTPAASIRAECGARGRLLLAEARRRKIDVRAVCYSDPEDGRKKR